MELRQKPTPFIRKAERILKVVAKGVHPEIPHHELLAELYPYIEMPVQ